MINFLTNCGNKNLQYLLVPSRLEAALAVLDTDRDGTIDAIEWRVSEPETLWRLRRVSRDGAGAEVRRGSPVDVPRREEAIETALAAKLEQRAKARELDAKAASKEIEEFTFEFKNAARECFQLIDKDHGGSLSKQEMSARCVRPSTRARRGDGAAALAVRRVWGGSSYAIDATRRLPRDPLAASTPSEATRR